MNIEVEQLPRVPAGNVYHYDHINVGSGLYNVTLQDKHKHIMLMGDAFSGHEVSFRVCNQETGERWRVILTS